jgi:hypothetical protein
MGVRVNFGESITGFREGKRVLTCCLSSIILSALNSNVKMSPHVTGDIHVESKKIATSERA